jgi:hypothetical protein
MRIEEIAQIIHATFVHSHTIGNEYPEWKEYRARKEYQATRCFRAAKQIQRLTTQKRWNERRKK